MLIDTHCHLFLDEYKHDLNDVLKRALKANIKAIINVGLEVKSNYTVLNMALNNNHGHDLHLGASIGWHPHGADKLKDSDLDILAQQAKEKGAVSFGEIGLDFYRNNSPQEVQIKALHKLLEVGLASKLPLSFHVRDAHFKFLEILNDYQIDVGIIHCFTGDWEIAKKYLDLNFYLSFPGIISFPKAKELHEVVKKTPVDRLILETDGPFLAPVPYRGKRNEPSFLVETLKALSKLTEKPETFWKKQTTDNVKQIFPSLLYD